MKQIAKRILVGMKLAKKISISLYLDHYGGSLLDLYMYFFSMFLFNCTLVNDYEKFTI